MKKLIWWWLLILCIGACAWFRSWVAPYPTGVVFPLKRGNEIAVEGRVTPALIQRNDKVLFLIQSGVIYCYDGQSREQLWTLQLEKGCEFPLFSGQTHLYAFDVASTLYCVSLEGQLEWKAFVGETISPGICESDSLVFLATETGKLIALTRDTGSQKWFFQAEGQIHSIPAFSSPTVVFGCDDNNIYFVNQNGTLRHKYECDDKIQSGLLVDGDYLFFGADDFYFYCYDLKKHRRKWRIKAGGKIRSMPRTDDRRVFFTAMNNVINCHDKRGGSLLWWKPLPARRAFSLEIIEEKVVVSAPATRMVCFSAPTGEEQGQYDTPWEIRTNPLWVPPFLLVAGYNRISGSSELLFLQKEVKVTLMSSKQSPQNINEEIVITATPVGFYLPVYEFSLSRMGMVRFGLDAYLPMPTGEQPAIVQESSEEKTWAWYPDTYGYYIIRVNVEDAKEMARGAIHFMVRKPDQIKQN